MDPVAQTPLAPQIQAAVNEVSLPKPHYFVRLFRGRMNRQNYSIGSLLLIIVPAIFYFIFVWELVSSPGTQSILTNNPYDSSVLQSPGFTTPNLNAAFSQLLHSPLNMVLAIIGSIYTIITLPLLVSLQARRLHDLNKSGWLMILNLIPFVNYVFPLYVTFFKGTPGENHYGPQPIKRTNIKEDILCLVDPKKVTTKIVNYNTLQPDVSNPEVSNPPL